MKPERLWHAVPCVCLGAFLALALSYASPANAEPTQPPNNPMPLVTGQTITWIGSAGDARWSNPANWEGQRVPGPLDRARFAAESTDARVDPAFGGLIEGIVLEPDYAGTVRLERPLAITGDFTIAGGTFAGEDAPLGIQGAARVRGGILNTPRAQMRVTSLDIQTPGIVRIGANGKLDLAGDGVPLTGNGVLDTTTNRPNSVEYTGHATSDLMAAGPLGEFRALGLGNGDVRQQLNTARHDPALAPESPQLSVTNPSLTLQLGEDAVRSAVVDSTGSYAYFGTTTAPGIVVKVDTSTMTRVGALTLNTGENYLYSAVLDGGYAYFGTGTYPGIVVKVQLSNFSRVGALTLDSNENSLMGAALDATNHYAYFVTYTIPGKVVKIQLSNFSNSGYANLGDGDNYAWAAALDTTDPNNPYLYVGTFTSPGRVAKVNVSTMNYVGTLALNAGEESLRSAVVDGTRGYGYFGTDTVPGKIIRVRLSDLYHMDTLTLSGVQAQLHAAVIDATNGYAYFATGGGVNQVLKIDVASATMSVVGSPLSLNSDEQLINAAALDSAHGDAYFATFSTPGKVIKVHLSPLSRVGGTSLLAGDNYPRAAVVDSTNGYAYFAMYSDPGKIVKVRLQDFTRVGAITLNSGETNLTSGFLDAANGYAYFGTMAPGRVIKIKLSDFTRVTALSLPDSVGSIYSAVLDAANGYGYFGTNTSPAQIAKVHLTDMSFDSAISLGLGENSARAAIPQAVNGYAYFGTDTSPGRVVKVRLSDFVRDSAYPLNTGENNVISAVLDPSNAYGYFATNTFPPALVKVDLGTMTRAGALAFGPTDSSFASGVVDATSGYAYFGTNNSPGRIVKVRLADFTRVGAVDLHNGETLPMSAVMDAAHGYAYFGMSTAPGIVVRVDLGNTQTTITSSLHPSTYGQSVTFTATVSAVTTGTPTGSVTFKDGTTPICSNVALSGGQATCITSALSIGTHTVTGTYNGDTSFNPSTGTVAPEQVVSKGSTQMALISSANPSIVGHSVTFTATVSAEIAGDPTGSVTFKDGATPICSNIALSGGHAVCTTSALSAGTHMITGLYSGDTDFNSSTGTLSPNQAVDLGNTLTTLTCSGNPSILGHAVTFTATVSALTTGTATGSVTFKDGATPICSNVALAGGEASCTTSALSAGTHTITGQYSGDTLFSSSTGSLAPSHEVDNPNVYLPLLER